MNRLPKDNENEGSQPLKMNLSGTVLVATPRLEDDIFGRSVCLVLEHVQDHSVGVMLNRPFTLDVAPLWQELTSGLSKTASPPSHLHFGGPVSGPVVAIHDRESLAEAGNGTGVYLAAQVENLKKLVLIPPKHYRLFVGHAAWKSGQLEQEIRDGFWYPLPADPELVFGDDFDMWQQGMRRVGNYMMQSVIGLPNMPKNSSDN